MTGSKTALVTGAAGGIGRATAERLARNGWNVLAADRDGEKLAWADAAGVASLVADVTSEADNRRLVVEAEARFGRLDATVLNAGITGGGGIEEISFDAFQRVIAVNLFGAVLGIRAALPALRRQGGGAIVVTSSTMGIGAEAGNSAYSASKHALIGLVRSVAREVGWEGIRVNALCPGPTETDMTVPVKDAAPAHYDVLKRAVPLQRWAAADEMASVIEFLVSPGASYVNGHAMVADGGAVVGTGLIAPASGEGKPIPDDVNR